MDLICCNQVLDLTEKDSNLPWYALKVRTGAEPRLKTTLQNKGYDVFLPTWLDCRRYSDRIKRVQASLFPGYLFCRIDISRRLPILTTTGVDFIVGCGGEPSPLDEGEISAIRRMVEANSGAIPWPYLHVGDRVRVQFGPFTGIEGFVRRADGKDRLILSLHLLQRSVAVEIDRSHVRPVAAGPTSLAS
jgi:transcription antitermination factor NusG